MEKAVKKLDRRVVKTRRAIREAFRRKLEQGPLKAITVSGLASEADIDRKTFYLHFSSIDDLVDAEVRELLEHLVAAALRSSGQPGVVIDLRRVLLAFRDLTEEDPVIYERLLNSVPMEAIIDMVQPAIFEELHGSEADDPERALAAEYLARYYLGGVFSVFLHWFKYDQDTPLEQLIATVEQQAGGALAFRPVVLR